MSCIFLTAQSEDRFLKVVSEEGLETGQTRQIRSHRRYNLDGGGVRNAPGYPV